MHLPLNSPFARDIAHHLHPFTNLAAHEERGPLILEKGDGIYVSDTDGNRYIEAMAGLWCTALGFSETRLAQAAMEQMNRLPYYHGFAHKSNSAVADLAEKLISLAPASMSRAFFGCSGSEAVDTAIKMVRYYANATGRPDKIKIIAREQAYHGVTLAGSSLTGLGPVHRDFGLPLDFVLRTGCPNYYRFSEDGENEAAFAARRVRELEELIAREGADTIGAFIAEPVMGAGGVIMPPPGYFAGVQDVLKKNDILFIADEVICGFHRTGNPWGAQTYGLTPDIITCAKQLSSGYAPISAVLVNDPVYEAIRDNSGRIGIFGHGFTYSGHPLCAAVALRTLEIYEEDAIADHVAQVTPVFARGIEGLRDHPLVGEARSVGLIGGFEIMRDGSARQPFEAQTGIMAKIMAFAEARGVITRAVVDTLAICPPLIITAEEIEETLKRYRLALDDTYMWARTEGLLA